MGYLARASRAVVVFKGTARGRASCVVGRAGWGAPALAGARPRGPPGPPRVPGDARGAPVGAGAGRRAQVLKGAAARAALGRISQPEEQAAAAIWLLSDGASFITGENTNINGGAAFG